MLLRTRFEKVENWRAVLGEFHLKETTGREIHRKIDMIVRVSYSVYLLCFWGFFFEKMNNILKFLPRMIYSEAVPCFEITIGRM